MNTVRKSLLGLGLVAMLVAAGCGSGASKNAKGDATKQAEQTEVQSGGASTTAATPATEEVLSTVNVKLTDGRVELSEIETPSGQLDFKVLNETTEPLHMEVIKTEIDLVELEVKEGKVDETQEGVEVFSESRDQPVPAGEEEVIRETLTPGKYYVVVTSTSKAEPVAFSVLTVNP